MIEKYKICILANEFSNDHLLWVRTLDSHSDSIKYSIIDITLNNWLEKVLHSDARLFIARPPGISDQSKKLYDERLYIIAKVLNKSIYPSLEETMVYENKKFLSYYLVANGIPHPKTNVFYSKNEAEEFSQNCTYPVVAKVNIGASGSGVRILSNHDQVIEYINRAFSGKGAPKRWGPNIEKGNLFIRGLHYIFYPSEILKKVNIYSAKRNAKQAGFVIFQEYIKHSYEWRCVRIGNSYFAHKKLIISEKASGTLIKKYETPSVKLLNFIKLITEKIEFSSAAIDLFETDNGDFLVNEIQCYFGQSDPYQMKVNDKIGRYLFVNNQWEFEEGDFAKNESYDLRYNHLMSILDSI